MSDSIKKVMGDGLFIRSFIFRHYIVLSFSLTNDSFCMLLKQIPIFIVLNDLTAVGM